MATDMAVLVEGLGDVSGDVRFASYRALVDAGASALPAIRSGLRSPEWQVRRWSAMCLDQIADEEALRNLVPLMRDPNAKVRLWAVHSVACEHCKEDVSCPIDVVPHLIERIRTDPSIRVRRMAVIMLSTEFTDARAVPVLEEVMETETDGKLLAHAKRGLEQLGLAGPLRVVGRGLLRNAASARRDHPSLGQ